MMLSHCHVPAAYLFRLVADKHDKLRDKEKEDKKASEKSRSDTKDTVRLHCGVFTLFRVTQWGVYLPPAPPG